MLPLECIMCMNYCVAEGLHVSVQWKRENRRLTG